MGAAQDYAAGGDAAYTGDGYTLNTIDAAEWQKMVPYQAAPAGNEAAPWWQNLVSFGVTRAIDNTFPGQATRVQGNTQPGSFAGQNGRTYIQPGGLNAAPTTVGGVVGSIAGMSPLMMGLIAAGLIYALKK